jgi:hypothetical protein
MTKADQVLKSVIAGKVESKVTVRSCFRTGERLFGVTSMALVREVDSLTVKAVSETGETALTETFTV